MTMHMEGDKQSRGVLARPLTRRQAIKAGGIGAVGLVFAKPVIETIIPKPAFANYVTTPPTTQLQGCTPGYWKNHTENWPSPYVSGALFSAYFTVPAAYSSSLGTKTLLEALGQGGGCEKALGRHAVAALLNAKHSGVQYGKSETQITNEVSNALATTNCTTIEAKKDELEGLNEAGCTL